MPRIVVPMFSPLEQLLSSVPGKDHVSPIAQHQVAVDLHAAGDEAVDLLQDAGRIDHHATGDHALHLGAENAAGNERQLVGLPAGDHGVAGVAAALVADDDFVLIGQQVDEFSLGFVSPLQPNDTGNAHRRTSRSSKAGRGPSAATQSPLNPTTKPTSVGPLPQAGQGGRRPGNRPI
jgi:hypothetical protein